MARRLERGGHPTGVPVRVFEFPGRARPASFFGGSSTDTFNAVPGRFIGVLGELSYNIWLMDLPK